MHHWDGLYGPPSPGYLFAHLIFSGLTSLFWIGLLGMLFWAALQSYRSSDKTALPVAEDDPSELELLRRRYIFGQIDIETFGELVVPLLELEEPARLG